MGEIHLFFLNFFIFSFSSFLHFSHILLLLVVVVLVVVLLLKPQLNKPVPEEGGMVTLDDEGSCSLLNLS